MTSRRQFLRTAASASLATAAAGSALAVHVTEATASDSVAAKVDALLVEYLAETREEKRLCRLYGKAERSLPAWARRGGSHLLPDGSKGGPESGWPEAAELPALPTGDGASVVIRQGPREYWKDSKAKLYEPWKAVQQPDGSVTIPAMVPLAGEARRAAHREMVAGVRVLIARRREQEAAKAAAGLPQIEAAIDAVGERRDALRDRMEDAATDASPTAIATLALLEAHFDAAAFPMAVLRLTAPHLTGLLRVVVDDMLANAEDDGNGTIFATGMIEGSASA